MSPPLRPSPYRYTNFGPFCNGVDCNGGGHYDMFLLFIIVCMTHRSNNNKKNKQDIMALEYRKNKINCAIYFAKYQANGGDSL